MTELHWDRHKRADREAFAKGLAPLIAASRCKDFDDPASARTQLHVWMLSLQDVPRPIFAEAIERVITNGVTWMPRPGDLKMVCADIVDIRRRDAAIRAANLRDECAQCGGSQWVSEVSDGVETVKRCWCFTRGLELIAEAGEPLKRPALPANTDPEAA